jgi:hypothetical protein
MGDANYVGPRKPEEDMLLKHIWTDKQLADIFIEPLDESILCKSRSELNILAFSNVS